MDVEREFRQLADELDDVLVRFDDLIDPPTSGGGPDAEENRTIRLVRARLAREQAVRLRADFRRVADRTEELLASLVDRCPDTADSRDATEPSRSGRQVIGQATGVLRQRHQLSAELACECLSSTARASGLDLLDAAALVLASVDEPGTSALVEPLDAVLRRVPRSQVGLQPVALHRTRGGGRPMVQLHYRTEDAPDGSGLGEFVGFQPPAGPVSTYEIVKPGTALLEHDEWEQPLGAGRGVRWLRRTSRPRRPPWPDAEALVAAMVSRRAAQRVATHLGCPLIDQDVRTHGT